MRIFRILIVFLIPCSIVAQSQDQLFLEKHLRILSSDEMKGRKTGEDSYLVAARYVAEELRSYGIQAAGEQDYYQQVPFKKIKPAVSGSLTIHDQQFVHGEDVLITRGPQDTVPMEVIFAGYALPEDLENENIDVKGKFVLARQGGPETTDPGAVFGLSRDKREYLQQKGALGLIETYSLRVPWAYLKDYFVRESLALWSPSDTSNFYYSLLNKGLDDLGVDSTTHMLTGQIEYHPNPIIKINSPNVIGMLEGTDPSLKDEYVIVSAHLDHVGIGKANSEDTIFNGARDNAIGVSSLLYAANQLSKNPPKRSIVFIAFTGEEIGLLGSEYYAEHPVIPLSQCIYNLNCDGAGYNDTTLVSIFGLERTGTKELIVQACSEVGLEVFGDPAPEQNLFDRSDNVSFAKKGIPAPTFSPGFKEFDQAIMANYHQPSDEFSTLNMNYVYKFAQAFAKTAQLVADREERPHWSEGDKYEEAFQNLYGKE